MPRPSTTPVRLLLVEDNEDDADLMIKALQEGSLLLNIDAVEDGEEAMEFLRGQGRHAGAPRPHLILLDLHLPRMSGHEVLAEVKEDPDLRRIPVVIMTSSDRETAFVDAYNLHANCCVPKPTDQEEYAQTVMKIERFWLTVAQV
jgi:CheY-like chemotaxis protein